MRQRLPGEDSLPGVHVGAIRFHLCYGPQPDLSVALPQWGFLVFAAGGWQPLGGKHCDGCSATSIMRASRKQHAHRDNRKVKASVDARLLVLLLAVNCLHRQEEELVALA